MPDTTKILAEVLRDADPIKPRGRYLVTERSVARELAKRNLAIVEVGGLEAALSDTRTHAVAMTDYLYGTFTECLDAEAVRAALAHTETEGAEGA